jgi:hypothetical protein
MKKVTLKIETRDESKTISLEDEISIGRTDSANIALDDVGLSRVNTTFFRDGEMVLVVDEKSLNGTFLNGEKIGSKPVRVLDGDTIKLGVETYITVEIESEKSAAKTQKPPEIIEEKKETPAAKPSPSAVPNPPMKKPPWLIIGSVASTFLIVFLAVVTVVLVRIYKKPGGNTPTPTTQVRSASVIPIRVIDPLGGGDAQDIDDIMTFWDVQEDELNTSDVAAVTSESSVAKIKLDVSLDFFKKQMDRSKAQRNGPTGNDPPGQIIPPQLRQGFAAQTAKIKELQSKGYKIPLDFADLAEKRIANKLIELPMATEDYVLDVGGSSDGNPFNNFSFETNPRSQPITQGSTDFNILSQLAGNYDGQKYDLNNASDRRQMKIRMLRMFHPSAKPILEKLAKDYRTKFGYPLRITSLSRSMEYQISLNKGNPNSYVVRGAGSLPPHTSGCTFDLSRKFMTAEEQNFLMQELATMETQGIVDALREGNVNACFHVFILGGCDV